MMEFVADDGDGDENCYPISYTFVDQASGSIVTLTYVIAGVMMPSCLYISTTL